MSQLRLARLSLIVAALGLNAAPLLLGAGAQAQSKPAAPAADAPKPDTVRPEMYKLLDPNVFKTELEAKQYADLASRIQQADAFPDKTPYEVYIINRMRIPLGSKSGDEKMAMLGLETVINSGRIKGEELGNFIQALASYYYNAKDYAKAILWFKRFGTETGNLAPVRNSLIRAYYLSNDFASALQELQVVIAASNGAAPDLEDLRLFASAAAKQKDKVLYLQAMEKLVAYYPSDDYWTDVLSRVQGKPNFNTRLQLDVYRLQSKVVKTMAPEDYTDMAELDLQAGFPTEAKKALDAGFAAGVLGTGPNAAKHKKLRDQANKGAADDQKNIGSGEDKAMKLKDGTGLVNLGYAYATMDQFDKGIDLMKKGIERGGLKHPEDAKLHLGMAYLMAGRKAEAVQALESVKGTEGESDLARYWGFYMNRPVAAAAAPAAAAK